MAYQLLECHSGPQSPSPILRRNLSQTSFPSTRFWRRIIKSCCKQGASFGIAPNILSSSKAVYKETLAGR
nr:hypothetical protein Iba_chr08eCG8360 [Ipomoea batatas]